MHGWWVLMGVIAAVVVAPRVHRRRCRRARVDRVRAELSTWLPALNQPDDSPGDPGIGVPPTSGSTSPPQAVVRCRRTLMFGALYPDISVGPRRVA
jgi:hypothetical protein